MFSTLHIVAKTKQESEKHATWQRYEVIYISKSYMYARSHHKNLIFMLRFLCFNLFSIEAERQTQLARYPAAPESKERKKKMHRHILVFLFRCLYLALRKKLFVNLQRFSRQLNYTMLQ